MKQVWAVGRWLILECRWMRKFKDLSPSIGTRSVPVTKNRNAFFYSYYNDLSSYQRCLMIGVSSVYPPS